MRNAFTLLLSLSCNLVTSSLAAAAPLVSAETLKSQQDAAQEFTLANGIPVAYYSIPGSEILQLSVSFQYGLRDMNKVEKPALQVAMAAMAVAAEGYPKEKIFALSEKYTAGVSCSGGVEASACYLTTVNDYWLELLPMLAAIVKAPSFAPRDVELVRERRLAELKSEIQEPGSYINEVVNRVYYPDNHPYRLSSDDSLKALEKVGVLRLVNIHKELLNAARMRIVVVGSLPPAELKTALDKAFGKIAKRKFAPIPVRSPVFVPGRALAYQPKDIPTAYIRMKFNTPGARAADLIPARLMLSVLDEELGDLVRTKRSLSYAVSAGAVEYELGIGMISASTSKPKETLEAIQEVIQKIRTRLLSAKELQEYKNVYATHYFLTLEEHASLAVALGNIFQTFGNLKPFFELTRQLDAVTAEDIKAQAAKLLVNFRIGVIAAKTQFQPAWAEALIKAERQH